MLKLIAWLYPALALLTWLLLHWVSLVSEAGATGQLLSLLGFPAVVLFYFLFLTSPVWLVAMLLVALRLVRRFRRALSSPGQVARPAEEKSY